ncbi:hypothetical protein HOLleu_41002 [Holothuria leucospilota]|uniref:Uncharacterized protein n=1 Tax=Holothuria leucospilota TaxID=206669 RepID=A0A9Q0YAY3_HOLLE|nr:hypothetical protein HOLleu_41002 [Holothuria leucospilota]
MLYYNPQETEDLPLQAQVCTLLQNECSVTSSKLSLLLVKWFEIHGICNLLRKETWECFEQNKDKQKQSKLLAGCSTYKDTPDTETAAKI